MKITKLVAEELPVANKLSATEQHITKIVVVTVTVPMIIIVLKEQLQHTTFLMVAELVRWYTEEQIQLVMKMVRKKLFPVAILTLVPQMKRLNVTIRHHWNQAHHRLMVLLALTVPEVVFCL